MYPGFSERTFEFCFNSEYCKLNAGVLATHPHIPSQNQEKDLGYDVEFKIREGEFTRSVFFQHKVAHFAEYRVGRNAQFYDTYSGPYFRFPVDKEQHNLLCKLSREWGNTFYCGPRFHLSHELEAYYRSDSISSSSILIDPIQVGEISDAERHNITYDAVGGNATVHSEPRRFEAVYGGGRERAPNLHQIEITSELVAELSDKIYRHMQDSEIRVHIPLPSALGQMRPLNRVQVILGRIYQVSWVLLP
jgi:hypothetical protein